MENSKSNLLLCLMCDKEIISLGIESQIVSDHQEHDDMYGNLDYNDFKADPHLKCRITCARYHVVGLGSRWFIKSQFNITNNNKVAYEAIEKIKLMNYQEMRSSGLYLYGSPGTGKTHLLTDLCRCIIDRYTRPTNISWGNTSSFLTKIRSSFGKKYEYGEKTAQEEILEKLKTKYLFLDDLGTESATEWAREILYEAINYRYEERLPLFISSNLSPQELAEKMGDKFVSRIVEMCKSVKVVGEDMRLQKSDAKEENFNTILPEFSYRMAYWDLKD